MRELGKYEILEVIGRGGFAVVYKARDPHLDRLVALKVLHAHWTGDPSFVTRFHQEARTVAGLRHPNIVTIYETGEAEGQLYIAMEYLPGRTLQDLLEAEGVLSLEQALPILEQLADALDHAHAQGVVHRDVKPSNVVVEETECGVRATLMDFGLVKTMADSTILTSQGTLMGSPEYMAPEQVDPNRAVEIGPATDRYALGIVSYQMLTGRVPFTGNGPSTLVAHMQKVPPDPRAIREDLPPGVARALIKALSKRPDKRHPTGKAMVEALRKAQDRPVTEGETHVASPKIGWLLLGFILTGIAVILFNRPIRCFIEYRMDDAVVALIALLIGGAALAFTEILSPDVQKVLRLVIGGFALALLISVVAIRFLPPPAEGVCYSVVPEIPLPTTTATDLPMENPTEASATGPFPTPPTPTSENCDSNGCVGDTLIRPIDKVVMVYVPGGEFEMGTNYDEIGYALQLCKEHYGGCESGPFDYDQSPHIVSLDSFWIDKTEVPNFAYQKCEEKGWCETPGDSWVHDQYYSSSVYTSHPVIGVNLHQAEAYCKWAGARLPTEEEWEYAARGPEGNVFPWGDVFDGTRLNYCDESCDRDWADASVNDGYGITAPVESYPGGRSWCYALNMAGNVWEWVADRVGGRGVLRGGSWNSFLYSARCGHRHLEDFDEANNARGFRCAKDAE